MRVYASQLENVAGYYIGSGWYGIVLGPYRRPDAETLLARLRTSGRIPSDSFIATGSAFQQQFWPIGVAAETRAQPLPGREADLSRMLTGRERDVVGLVAEGMTNKEIARRLDISPATVKVHVERIIGKLGVADRTQAAVLVTQMRRGEG